MFALLQALRGDGRGLAAMLQGGTNDARQLVQISLADVRGGSVVEGQAGTPPETTTKGVPSLPATACSRAARPS